MSNLYNGLLGRTGTGNGPRLLDVWHENAYRHLADANDLNYTIPSYVDEMDVKLEAVLELIRNGLILLIMTTQGTYHAVPLGVNGTIPSDMSSYRSETS